MGSSSLCLVELLLELSLNLLDSSLVLFHVREDEVVVDGGGAHSGWVEEEHKESQLQEIVEWDELENHTGELVDHVEGSETHPVCEPLLVVINSLGLESNETHECWIGNPNDIGNVGLANAKHDEENSCNEGVLKEVLDGNSGCITDLL